MPAARCKPHCQCGKHNQTPEHKARTAISASKSWTPERRRALGARTKGISIKTGRPAEGSYIEADGYRHLTGQQNHPLAKRTGIVAEHRMVLYDKIGPGPHECYWKCGKTLEWRGPYANRITADHLNGEQLDNRPENLVPACHVCNSCRAKAGDPTDWQPGQRNPLCGKGHQYTPVNTGLRKNGHRYCRTCARDAEKSRRVARHPEPDDESEPDDA